MNKEIQEVRTPEGAEDTFSYELLSGHYRTDGSYKTGKELRMEYLQLTDRLISTITDGKRMRDHDTGEEVRRPYDAVIFLDKSARPVAWLTNKLWSKFAGDSEGRVPKKPVFHFLNIDREQWVNIVDTNGTGYMDIGAVDDTVIRSLRSIFIMPQHKAEGLMVGIDNTPASLDKKNILVVDEVFSTGRTLDIAKKFLGRAFPSAEITGTYWMRGVGTKNNGLAVGNRDVPVWYSDKAITGRGVGDRNSYSDNSKNITQRLGRWFLSSRFPSPDSASLLLREEIEQLARHPDVPVRPDVNRDDYDERLSRYNGGVSAKEVVRMIQEVRSQEK